MRVYLVQHGESKSEEEDPQRRLTDKGIGEVQKVANFLRLLKLALDAVWHSGRARAQQTGELLRGGGRGSGSCCTARKASGQKTRLQQPNKRSNKPASYPSEFRPYLVRRSVSVK